MPRTYVKKGQGSRYSEEDFHSALKEISNEINIHSIAKKYNIPYSTLYVHHFSQVAHRGAGRSTHFTDMEETYLVSAATISQEWGEPLTPEDLVQMAAYYAQEFGKEKSFQGGRPTIEWYYSFMLRHPELKTAKPIPLKSQLAKVTKPTIDKWFDLLEKVIVDNDLMDKPPQIFNCDESGFSDETERTTVIVPSPTKFPYKKQGGTGGKSFYSVLFCVSASGVILPPYTIYKAKRLMSNWCLGGPSGAGYNTSKNGWIQEDVFYEWLKCMFIPYTDKTPKPILLLLDGHGSHHSVRTVELAIENHIVLLCLPANSTHILQPLHVVFFKPIKQKYLEILNEYYKTSAVRKVNIIKGFMTAGIYPLDKTSVNLQKILRCNEQIERNIADAADDQQQHINVEEEEEKSQCSVKTAPSTTTQLYTTRALSKFASSNRQGLESNLWINDSKINSVQLL
ncbi:unnamed protein product [Didymodactylos carnosus]|uniref:DDE-1 domain-containing protein n=2 Tax=Didymodactylos carnosus TaxID=1234261 RepID=A0A8S2FAK5_9BILA|nr:unnamed protein product [Didymodactylos carnosus]CAF4209383.1 unnamed protein product [Didymodactylos carnosus]